MTKDKTDKKKVSASLKHAINNYLYSLTIVADQIIADRKHNLQDLLKRQELSTRDLVLEEEEPALTIAEEE